MEVREEDSQGHRVRDSADPHENRRVTPQNPPVGFLCAFACVCVCVCVLEGEAGEYRDHRVPLLVSALLPRG